MSQNSDRIFGVGNSTGTIPMNTLTVGMGFWNIFSSIDKFGKNEDVDTVYVDVWTPDITISYLSAADTIDVVSTDANDTLAGTGAQKVTIQGLDGDFNELSEEVDMDGLTPVTTTGSFIRIFRVQVTQAGTGLTNAGIITLTDTTGASTQAQILADEGQTQMALYTIPNGKTGYFEDIFVSTNSSNIITAQLRARPDGEGWQVKREVIVTAGTSTQSMAGSGSLAAKTDIAWRAKANNPNNIVSAGFKLILKTT